jgi:DNA-binding XRE family transcriptional regulator
MAATILAKDASFVAMDPTPLREARGAARLSQAALAATAGISRQAVGAIEAGLHRPGVDAAMALATAVGRSVEELFAAPPRSTPVSVLGEPAPDGSGVLAARVGERVVYAPARAALAIDGWPRANAVMRDGRPQPLPGSDLDGLVLVGCDPALGLAAAMLPSSGPHRLVALSGSTAAALAALGDGRAHAALVHGPARRLPPPPAGTLRLHLARWRVGLASRGQRPRAVAELASRGARVVQREEGASSQKAFAAAMAAEGAPLPRGPVASGHLDAARRVAYGATAGVTMEPAAIGMELAFAPLEEHVAEVWIDARWREHSGVDAVGELLRSNAFTTRLALVGGYELAGCGERSG